MEDYHKRFKVALKVTVYTWYHSLLFYWLLCSLVNRFQFCNLLEKESMYITFFLWKQQKIVMYTKFNKSQFALGLDLRNII